MSNDQKADAPPSLFPHQLDALRWLENHPRALLGDAVGLGKAAVACHWSATVLADAAPAGVKPMILWITEAALMGQARSELGRFTPQLNVASSAEPALRDITPSERALKRYHSAHPGGPDVLVVSYEFARARLDSLTELTLVGIVADEVAAVRGGGAEWAAVKALCGSVSRVLGLTATLGETSPIDAHNVASALHLPGLMDLDWFEATEVIWKEGYRTKWGAQIPAKPIGWAPGAAEYFREWLSTVCLRRTAEDVGLRMPTPATVQVRRTPLTPGQRRDLRAAQNMQGLRGHAARERAGRIGTDGSSSVIDAAMAELLSRPDGEKTVMATDTLDALKLLAQRLTAAGIRFVSVEGVTPAAERAEAVHAFSTDPGIRVFLGSRVLTRGLNLQVARTLLTCDATWNPAQEAQRVGRIRRIGSPHATYDSITFIPDTELSQRKLGALNAREDTAAAIGF